MQSRPVSELLGVGRIRLKSFRIEVSRSRLESPGIGVDRSRSHSESSTVDQSRPGSETIGVNWSVSLKHNRKITLHCSANN